MAPPSSNIKPYKNDNEKSRSVNPYLLTNEYKITLKYRIIYPFPIPS